MNPGSGVVIAEFHLDHPILRHALQTAPGVEITWERSDPIDDERIRFLVWVEGEDVAEFEAALVDDPTVTTPRRTVEIGGRRLYHLELVGPGRRTSTYPVIADEGGLIQELTADSDGWQLRATFPDFEAFTRFREFCESHDIPLRLLAVYTESDASGTATYGLTDRQRAVLVAALHAGYFDIPRSASLAELAETLDISGNAASERLRRGMETLVENTVGADS